MKRRQLASRIRRSLGWSLLFSLGFAGMLLWHLETCRAHAIDPDFHDRVSILKVRLKERPTAPLCLILGSSRVDHGVFPDLMPELKTPDGKRALVFNCSHNGAGPLMQLIHYRRLRESGVHPAWLVLEVMPPYYALETHRFLGSTLEFDEWWAFRDRLSWHQSLRAGLRRRVEVLPEQMLDALADTTGVKLCATSPLRPHLRPLGGRGDIPEHPDQARQQVALGIQHKYYWTTLQRFELSPISDRALRDLLALCRADGVRVVLLISPEGESFRSWYRPGAPDLLRSYLAGISRETGVPVVDAREWLSDTDMLDSHHPSLAGARKLTARLANEVLRPWIGGQSPTTIPVSGNH